MVRPVLGKVLSISLVALVAGCGAPKSQIELTRQAAAIQVPQPASLSYLSRKFRAETPYFVNFDFDLDNLDQAAIERLDAQADWIIDNPNVRFRVYGHTDKVGSNDYNIDLGLRRAENVVAYLVSRGISEHRLEIMTTFGEEIPIIETELPERMNRRALTDVAGIIRPERDDDDDDNGQPNTVVSKVPTDEPEEPCGCKDEDGPRERPGSDQPVL